MGVYVLGKARCQTSFLVVNLKMAKSIRSKFRRQMRNIKREHFAKKDLDRLKQCAERTEELVKDNVVQMKTVEEIKEAANTSDSMDVDSNKKAIDKKTLRDEDGNYAKWMNQRAC